MKIPLIKPDLPSLEAIAGDFKEILDNGKITNFSKYVTMFEEEAGAYLGTHTVTVSSCTMGLIVTLQAMGLKPGEKVILPSFTFVATAQAVLFAGGVPVFADIGEDLTISVSELESLLAKHRDVGAVVPVHVYGLPAQTEKIQEAVAAASRQRPRPIPIVYDAAHAFGSAINGKNAGGFGDAEVFSFSVTKLLVSVEGGMVSSNKQDLLDRIRKMRNYGIQEHYDAHWPGLNGKMSEFHAIIGLYNLRRLPALLEERSRKGSKFLERIRGRTRFETMAVPAGVTHTFKDLTILVPEECSIHRDRVMEFLGGRGIETRAYFFPPVHEQEFFRRFSDRPLPFTERLARRVITLPFYTTISEAEIDYIVDSLVEAERRLV